MELDRRSFLKGALATGTLAAASGALAACSPSGGGEAGGGAPAEGGGAPVAATDYKAKPEPISADQIAETLEADVVVVGAGIAGSSAALQASKNGAKVIVLQKEAGVISNGMGFGAYGTQMQKDAGQDWDVEEEINRWMRESEYRSDRKLVHRWAEFSGPVLDEMVALAANDEASQPILYDPAFNVVYPDPWNFAYSGGIVFLGSGGTIRICELQLEAAEANGTEVYYSTPAKQLLVDESGKVTGVVAQKEDGSYVQVNAAKGVVLAAGDYGNNPDFRKEYMPHVEGLESAYMAKSNQGDGHLMGLWVGAQMQKGPHAGNIHYDPALPPAPSVAGSGCPWLWVNFNGERFCNEDCSYGQIYAQAMNQPEFMHYQVFDDNFAADVEAGKMGEGNNKNGPFPGFGMAFIQPQIEEGLVLSADTIEDLAAQMNVPADALVATVARYNELVELGVDEDFGKQAARLTAIVKAPFHAILRKPSLLCSLGGLVINENMEVLDDSGAVIPGLWAAGNNSGNWFGGLEHPMVIPGMSLGRAAVTGYLAGLSAAGVTY
ncbi:MAG: FAD-dependent oxidoreductase [Coriobacteriales bacterium]|jgi:fumarate reductase flavoprotein subunit|nr:FAD-dependent oxidoreductase [Coriobacteriales bacterium]